MRTEDDMPDQSDSGEAEEMSDGDDAETMFVSSHHCRSDRASDGSNSNSIPLIFKHWTPYFHPVRVNGALWLTLSSPNLKIAS